MTFRKLSLAELKKDYFKRHGFIFKGSSACDKNNCSKVSNAIIQKGICQEQPEFIVEYNNQTFFFVYREGVSFDSPAFIQNCGHLSTITGGAFQIEALSYFLQNYND